jgi:hypothetical protein
MGQKVALNQEAAMHFSVEMGVLTIALQIAAVVGKFFLSFSQNLFLSITLTHCA